MTLYEPGDTVWTMGEGGRVRAFEVQASGSPVDGALVEISQQIAASRLGEGRPSGLPVRWPFTPEEESAVRAAYEALTRVGNATMDRRVHGPDSGHWHPFLDRAHHDLGLLLVLLEGRAGAGSG